MASFTSNIIPSATKSSTALKSASGDSSGLTAAQIKNKATSSSKTQRSSTGTHSSTSFRWYKASTWASGVNEASAVSRGLGSGSRSTSSGRWLQRRSGTSDWNSFDDENFKEPTTLSALLMQLQAGFYFAILVAIAALPFTDYPMVTDPNSRIPERMVYPIVEGLVCITIYFLVIHYDIYVITDGDLIKWYILRYTIPSIVGVIALQEIFRASVATSYKNETIFVGLAISCVTGGFLPMLEACARCLGFAEWQSASAIIRALTSTSIESTPRKSSVVIPVVPNLAENDAEPTGAAMGNIDGEATNPNTRDPNTNPDAPKNIKSETDPNGNENKTDKNDTKSKTRSGSKNKSDDLATTLSTPKAPTKSPSIAWQLSMQRDMQQAQKKENTSAQQHPVGDQSCDTPSVGDHFGHGGGIAPPASFESCESLSAATCLNPKQVALCLLPGLFIVISACLLMIWVSIDIVLLLKRKEIVFKIFRPIIFMFLKRLLWYSFNLQYQIPGMLLPWARQYSVGSVFASHGLFTFIYIGVTPDFTSFLVFMLADWTVYSVRMWALSTPSECEGRSLLRPFFRRLRASLNWLRMPALDGQDELTMRGWFLVCENFWQTSCIATAGFIYLLVTADELLNTNHFEILRWTFFRSSENVIFVLIAGASDFLQDVVCHEYVKQMTRSSFRKHLGRGNYRGQFYFLLSGWCTSWCILPLVVILKISKHSEGE